MISLFIGMVLLTVTAVSAGLRQTVIVFIAGFYVLCVKSGGGNFLLYISDSGLFVVIDYCQLSGLDIPIGGNDSVNTSHRSFYERLADPAIAVDIHNLLDGSGTCGGDRENGYQQK